MRNYVLFLIVILFASCEDAKPTFSVVLCDISGTVSKISNKNKSFNSLPSVIDNAKKLLSFEDNHLIYEDNSRLVYLPIRENMYPTAIANVTLNDASQANYKKEMNRRREIGEKLEDSLIGLSKRHFDQTCILTSIAHSYKVFLENVKQYPPEDYNYELVILSDLIEDCSTSAAGNIDLEKRFDSAIADIQKFKPNINFSSINVNVKIIITTDNITAKENERLVSFWGTAFKNMGYTKQLNFVSTL